MPNTTHPAYVKACTAKEVTATSKAKLTTLLATNEDSRIEETQIDLLARLRVIEQLQRLSYPLLRRGYPDDVLVDILNWIAQCFAPNPSSDSVAVAFSTHKGFIVLHITHNQQNPTRKSIRSIAKVVLTTLRQVLREDEATEPGACHGIRCLFRMIVDLTYQRIHKKISRIAWTDGSLEETAVHFTSLVKSWIICRPEGEQSRGFMKMALNHGGNANRANEYMVQSFLTVVDQGHSDIQKLNPDERFTLLSSIITACNLLINSTFFNDLVNHHIFRSSLKIQDRYFLHKLLRRLTYIASYKTGAAKFAYLAVPFLRQVLGEDGVAEFVNAKSGAGRVQVDLVTEKLASVVPLSKTLRWQKSPLERLPSLLNIVDAGAISPTEATSSTPSPSSDVSPGLSEISDASGSTKCSSESKTSSSSGSGSQSTRTQLSAFDKRLRLELLHSDTMKEVWRKGDTTHVWCHSELQLIHYLERIRVDTGCQILGTSKPVCWACARYIGKVNVVLCERSSRWRDYGEMEEGEGEEECDELDNLIDEECDVNRWVLSRRVGKVYHDWMIPPLGKALESVDAVVHEAQAEMERVVEEVAFDCYG